jgi:hypothetical protein
MTTLFVATCGIACVFYLYVLVQLRRDQERSKKRQGAPKARVVEFRKAIANERQARRISA